jgi:hypothetical protein
MSVRLITDALKRCAVGHGEKCGLGAALLLVLAAGMQTDWTPYSRTPAELHERASAAQAVLTESSWPDSERTAFLAGVWLDARSLVDRSLHRRIPLARYAASLPMQQRPGPGFWPLEEPAYGVVQSLVADEGRALLRLAIVRPVNQPVEAPHPEEVPDEFRPSGSRTPHSGVKVPVHEPASSGRTEAGAPDEQDAVIRGRAYPLVSVRGVFDVNSQVRAYVDALHKGYADCARTFEILDFHLERQELIAGTTFWTEWRAVDVQVYYDVVSGCDGLETDVVSSDVIDSAITCPLPSRLSGRWNRLATHPELEAFELTEEDLAREVAYLKALLDETRRQNAVRRPGIRKGGFADLVRDPRELTEGLFGSMESGPRTVHPFAFRPETAHLSEDELIRRLAREIDPGQTDRQLREWVRDRANAARELVLFRYFDFDVDPGATYRYRVQLVLRNPNYGQPLALAGGAPHVVDGPTRLTPWSEPTAPVRVEDTTSAFLARIEAPRMRPWPEAQMWMYQYDLQTGTTVHQELAVACGQIVGGDAMATVIDPVRGVIEERNYTFRSGDVLVDGLADLAFPLSEHPDLALPTDSRRRAGCTEYAVLVDEHHQLRTLDPVAQRAARESQERRIVLQEKQFDELPTAGEAAEAGGSEYDEIYRQLYGDGATEGSVNPPPRPRHPLSGR